MSVEILMSTYNGERFVGEQLKTILNQSYKDFLLIIRDDGSTDQTLFLLEDFALKDPRIIIVKDNFGNIGCKSSFLELTKHSRAEVVLFADQDDIWMDFKVKRLVQEALLINSSIPGLVYSNSRYLKWKDDLRGYIYPKKANSLL